MALTLNPGPHRTPSPAPPMLSVVVPVFDEAEVLPRLHRRLSAVLDALPLSAEIVLVDDGSGDDSATVIRRLATADPRITLIELSRNFGKEAAMSAGLDHARGEAVVVIDADLQDPPELIADMVQGWRQGYDVVTARRTVRHGETWFKRWSSAAYYRLLRRAARVPIPVDVGDYRLMSRRVVEAVQRLPERNRYMKGLFAWVGFSQLELPYVRDARHAGHSKWPLWKLAGLALDGLTAFTWAPLRWAAVLGTLVILAALGLGLTLLLQALIFHHSPALVAGAICAMLLLGGLQLFALGIQGEYLGRLFVESKQRPLYLVKAISRSCEDEMAERRRDLAR